MNDSSDNIKRILSSYTVPEYDAEGISNTIEAVRLEARESKNIRVTGDLQFLMNQVLFIRRRMWVFQLAFLIGVLGIVALVSDRDYVMRYVMPFISVSMPMLILINITDFSRVYNEGIMEIEKAARFSLEKLMVAKLIVFGISDVVLLLIIALFSAANTQTDIISMIMYCAVPFNIMCIGSFALLRRVKAENFAVGEIILAAVIGIVVFACNTDGIIYSGMFDWAWITGLVITAGLILYQIAGLGKGEWTACIMHN